MEVFVTVGMGPWPFERLVAAAGALADDHSVFVQRGTSQVQPPCPHADYLPPEEMRERIATADVVVTHAGNTVRLVQRQGKVPIAVPRTVAHGEGGNDHQVEFLRHEERQGRVVPLWDVDDLPAAVAAHPQVQQRLLQERPAPSEPDPEHIASVLDQAYRRAAANPFVSHPLRRYPYAWERLMGRRGRHLDVGFGDGVFLATLADTTELECHGVEPHSARFAAFAAKRPDIPVAQVAPGDPLPYPDAHFSSISLLDVLEHVPDDRAMLREVRRVLEPGGQLVLTVPARHAFSFLDPDDVKLRFPRLHRALYSLRFGRQTYAERFQPRGDGLFGDMSVGAERHINYRPEELAGRARECGYEPVHRDGANLFWRLLPPLELVPDGAPRRLLDGALRLDGALFRRANLFLTLEAAA